jgi:hypothetical protein
MDKVQKLNSNEEYYFARGSLWVSNLVSDVKGGKRTEDV